MPILIIGFIYIYIYICNSFEKYLGMYPTIDYFELIRPDPVYNRLTERAIFH